MSSVLLRAATDLLTEIQNDNLHDMPIRGWLSIHHLLHDLGASEQAESRFCRRLYLETVAVERVLPLWREHAPTREDVPIMLRSVESCFAGAFSLLEAETLLFEVYPGPIGLDGVARTVFTASRALLDIAAMFVRNPSGFALPPTPESVPVGSPLVQSTPSYLASSAVAGGGSWWPGSDHGKRLDFWTWWLREAISMTFRRFPLPTPD